MQIHPIGYRIRGFYRAAKTGHRWQMDPQAQKRINILRFWKTHGTAALPRRSTIWVLPTMR